MGGVTFYTCFACGSYNAATYRRRWWRYLLPRQYNQIACPDCRHKGPNNSRSRVAKPYGFTYIEQGDS